MKEVKQNYDDVLDRGQEAEPGTNLYPYLREKRFYDVDESCHSPLLEHFQDADKRKEGDGDKKYDLSVLNTSHDAGQVVQMVRNAIEFDKKQGGKENGIRMLFYGVSGSGKSQFVRHIASKLDKKILSKHASDILGMYTGNTEQNIAKAFNEAKAQKKILVFDEVDSFLLERERTFHSWEITMVNEFLTQMEEFSGILICTTNLRQLMDKAMLRRFHLMVEFKPLMDAGVKPCWKAIFQNRSSPKNSLRGFADTRVRHRATLGTCFPGSGSWEKAAPRLHTSRMSCARCKKRKTVVKDGLGFKGDIQDGWKNQEIAFVPDTAWKSVRQRQIFGIADAEDFAEPQGVP